MKLIFSIRLLLSLSPSASARQPTALKWLFFSGFRGQQAFPLVALEPSIIQASIEGGEGTPGPMLSITGLTIEEVEFHLKKTNAHLPDLSVSYFSSQWSSRIRCY
ncbi:hypothetical protein Hypma_000009 [Hypsizygus marmoreus]|uniref:Uncharacterized protein n=1 Tax=Hypsizygus marmoreus TaxID=39966 RepID=A0A369KB10_HYPMA|nr:hypothetical protein Hypma_000009 [Hypsizygus marmoreus]